MLTKQIAVPASVRALFWGLFVALPGFVLMAWEMVLRQDRYGVISVPLLFLVPIGLGIGMGALVGWAVQARKLWWPLAALVALVLFVAEFYAALLVFLDQSVAQMRF